MALVVGVGLGTLTWFTALSAALALGAGRRRAGPRAVTAVDVVSGCALLGFAGLLAYRTVQSEG